MDPFLDKLVAAVSDSEDLESLVRPLLVLLESVTGLESTYFTRIDFERNVQRIVIFAQHTGNGNPRGTGSSNAWPAVYMCLDRKPGKRGYRGGRGHIRARAV